MAETQDYPVGTLYVVATPIGNLADITVRALSVLARMDAIACEDTRHTGALLRSYGLSATLLAVHEHNEAEAAQQVIRRLHNDERVAYVSDAGTPGVSDPGSRLCAAVWAAGLRCIPLPGASSVTALVSVAGWVASGASPAFEFTGFLPAKGAERTQALKRLQQQTHACVLLESPHRIMSLAEALAAWGDRPVTIGRELTKQFEEIATLPCRSLVAWLQGSEHRLKGEFVLALHPQPPTTPDEGLSPETRRVLALLLEALPVRQAARLGADITGESKNALYQAALQLKQTD